MGSLVLGQELQYRQDLFAATRQQIWLGEIRALHKRCSMFNKRVFVVVRCFLFCVRVRSLHLFGYFVRCCSVLRSCSESGLVWFHSLLIMYCIVVFVVWDLSCQAFVDTPATQCRKLNRSSAECLFEFCLLMFSCLCSDYVQYERLFVFGERCVWTALGN